MGEILLVNPRRRKRRKSKARRRRRAVRVVRRRRRRAAASAPRRRRRRSRAARRVRRISRRRNPSLRGLTSGLVPQIKAGITGALGALGLDVAIGYGAPKLPAQLQTGYGLTAVKIVGALLIGMLGGKVMRGKGTALATGAMTVVLHDELKKLVAEQFPAVPLGEYFSVAPTSGYPGVQYNPASGVGEYFTGDAGFGEYMESDSVYG